MPAPVARSSRPDVFCKKRVLKNFAKFTGKHLCQSLFFKVAGGACNFIKKESLEHLFFQNIFGGYFCVAYITLNDPYNTLQSDATLKKNLFRELILR